MKAVFVARLAPLFAFLVSLGVALLIGGGLIAVVQWDISAPFTAYAALFRGAFLSDVGWANTLRQMTPLLLTGSAVAVALAVGLFNIGAEGQMAVGALASAVVGASLRNFVPDFLLLPLSLLVGMIAGAGWAALPVFLKQKRGTHEVITAILLNYVAQSLTRFLTNGPLKDPSGQAPQTAEVAIFLPRLLPGYDVHVGLLLGLVTVAMLAFALSRTVWGLEVRAVGLGRTTAEASGIAVARVERNAMWLSGALAGLAGTVLILGEVPFRRFPADFYGIGYGFDGLAVALLATPFGSPSLWAILPSAFLFGALSAGAEAMAFDTPTPKQIVQVVQAILILAVAANRTGFLARVRRKHTTTTTGAGANP